jgi:chaperonin GroEL
MGKEVFYGSESRAKLLDGVNALADAVVVTLGPRGRNVIIETDTTPHITKDGVTVAKSIEFTDKTMNLGARVIKEAAQQTADNAGDGTTTSTVLAREIFKSGMDAIEKGANPIELKRGMDIAVKSIVNDLVQNISTKVETNDQIKQVATISANGDGVIGSMLADAMAQVGRDGVITVEEGNSNEDELTIVEGLEFEQGYLSHYFINNQTKLSCELEDPMILLYDGRISEMDDIVGILENVSSKNQSIVVVAQEVDGQALATMVVNAARQTLKCVAIKAPGFGNERSEMLKDMAALTGATLFGGVGKELEDITIDDLGSADRVVASKSKSVIIGGAGDSDEIKLRINQIKHEIDESSSDYEKEKLHKRLSKLAGGVAVLRVGAESEIEMKEKKDRIDDALLATKAAIEEGIVPGGGSALIHASDKLYLGDEELSRDQQAGVDIVCSACYAPFNAIMKNAGLDYISDGQDYGHTYGYNVVTEQYCDLLEAGVIDPTKVTRTALEKAVSVASTLLTTECMIVNEVEEIESSTQKV